MEVHRRRVRRGKLGRITVWIAGGLEATTGSNVVLEKRWTWPWGSHGMNFICFFYPICSSDGQRSSNGLPRPIWGRRPLVVAGKAAGRWNGNGSMGGTRANKKRGGETRKRGLVTKPCSLGDWPGFSRGRSDMRGAMSCGCPWWV